MQLTFRCHSSRSHLHLSTSVTFTSIGFKHHSSPAILESQQMVLLLKGNYTPIESKEVAPVHLKENKAQHGHC